MCIICLNLDLLLQSFNIYRKFGNKGESFEEANDDKGCKFYSYQKAVKAISKKKKGKPVEYQRTVCVDDSKPIKHRVSLIKDEGSKCKKHWSYVDNYSTIFPMMKDVYNGKFIEPNLI